MIGTAAGGCTIRVMRTLTEAQAFEAAMRYLRLHRENGWTIEMVLDAADNLGERDRSGAPVTFDPAEWQCWTKCVDEALAEDAR